MFGYVIKKAFFDLWDNLGLMLVINILFSALIAGSVSAIVALFPILKGITYLFFTVPIILLSIYQAAVQGIAREISFSGPLDRKQIPALLKKSIKPGLFLGALQQVLLVGGFLGIPCYWYQNQIMGFIFTIVYIWVVVFYLMASLHYYPAVYQFSEKPIAASKRAFLVFLHNPLASLGMGFGTLLILFLSVVTLGLFPGLSGISLWNQTTLKFIMLKHTFLDKESTRPANKKTNTQPATPKIPIPWETLVAPDMDRIGKRSFMGLFFPWRDMR